MTLAPEIFEEVQAATENKSERALTLFEELHGPDYVECAPVLTNVARSAEATGDRVGRARALKRAEEILWLQATARR